MSEASGKQTEQPAQPTAPTLETTKHSDKHGEHKSTSRPSSPLPEVAPTLGGVGVVFEDAEKADAAATSFQHHQVEPPADHQHKQLDTEKGSHVVTESASAGTGAPIVEKDGVIEGTDGSSGDDDNGNHYISGVPLVLLTFGLCMATFTVALDNTSKHFHLI